MSKSSFVGEISKLVQKWCHFFFNWKTKFCMKLVKSKTFIPEPSIIAQTNRSSIWNRLVFVWSPYDLAVKSYGMFSTDMQIRVKWLLTRCLHTITNGHIKTSVSLLWACNKDEKILHAIENRFMYISSQTNNFFRSWEPFQTGNIIEAWVVFTSTKKNTL